MGPALKALLHLFVSTAAVGAVSSIAQGAPITSGAVLIPSLTAGALAVGHAAFPSIFGWQQQDNQPPRILGGPR